MDRHRWPGSRRHRWRNLLFQFALGSIITPIPIEHRRYEKALRQRDGFVLSLADNAVLLVSTKARFGQADQNELLVDIMSAQGKFILSDWIFQTEDKKEKTLLQMPEHYPQLKGLKELNFLGVAVSPLFEPDQPENPQIIRFGQRDIHQELQSPDAVGALVAARIRSYLAMKFSS